MRTITLIGITTTGGEATEVTITNESPLASIMSGELLVAQHDHRSIEVLNSETAGDQTLFVGVNDGKGNAPDAAVDIAAAGGGSDFFVSSGYSNAGRSVLTVVTTTPAADGEIQLTDVNKFKLYLDAGMTENDTLILKVMIVGEVMRP